MSGRPTVPSFLGHLSLLALEIAGKQQSHGSQLESSQSCQNSPQTPCGPPDEGEVEGGVVGDRRQGAQACSEAEHAGREEENKKLLAVHGEVEELEMEKNKL